MGQVAGKGFVPGTSLGYFVKVGMLFCRGGTMPSRSIIMVPRPVMTRTMKNMMAQKEEPGNNEAT